MKKYTIEEIDNYLLIHNQGGKDIAVAKDAESAYIEVDGYAFRDLNHNGTLEPYEDWRLSEEERIADLVSRMSIHQMAGLMLYSAHQSVSSGGNVFAKMFQGTYNGKSFEESGCQIYELSDEQKKFLREDDLRHVLLTAVDDAETAAKWNNRMQEYAEKIGLGIPCNNSSDPRHIPSADTEFNAGAGGDISKWPDSLGMAATFDPQITKRFGQVASTEYRALGITTALSPQVDIATEPRWMRFSGTFGEDSALSADMARSYCDGFQTDEKTDGWGYGSVNAMVKHWPGGGSCEGGRDAHYQYGKYAVYPGKNFAEHLKPFTEGAFQLTGGTKEASAVMPYYTISYDQDEKNHENVGNSYSKYIIGDLLRDTYGYDGVVCTDWMITKDCERMDSFVGGKSWGVEALTEAERHAKAIEAGVDQFGGNNEIEPVLEAYRLGVSRHGEETMRKRFEKSAGRLLRNMFRTGLFENPYLDPEESEKIVGNSEFMKEGFAAQIKSVVMLKNKNHVLPVRNRQKVYIPKRRMAASRDWFGNEIPAREELPVPCNVIEQYYRLVEDPAEADFAIVFMESPQSCGYDPEKGYLPVTLQYRPYTAAVTRKESIAQDPRERIVNRSYYGKTNIANNEADLDVLLETRAAMKEKPVIASIRCTNPMVMGEVEPYADAILTDFNVQAQAVLELVSGRHEPSGLLPFQMPADMETVETQFEDVAHDMRCYVDEAGHRYDFAYGMDYQGVICDERVKKYGRG